jgi:hypothetical protein
MAANLEFHEVASVFPMMSDEEYQALAVDIKANGLREPIWTYQGKIIDGRNRYKACQDAGVEPEYREWSGTGSLVGFVVSLNLNRRHLTSSQKAMIAIEIEKCLAEENKTGRPAKDSENGGNISTVFGKSRDQAAALVGTNSHYVTDAKKIVEKAPELKEAVLSGALNIPDARIIAQLPEDRRRDVLAKVSADTGQQASRVTKDAVHQVRVELKGEAREREQAERMQKANTPEARGKKEQAEKEQYARWAEEEKQRGERRLAHASRVKALLNDPERSKLRTDLYAAAYKAEELLTQATRAYCTFLLRFTALLEGLTIEEDIAEVPREGYARSPWGWRYNESMQSIQSRSEWLKRVIEEVYDGCPEVLLAQCGCDPRLRNGTSLPFVDFVALQEWVDDPFDKNDEAEPSSEQGASDVE